MDVLRSFFEMLASPAEVTRGFVVLAIVSLLVFAYLYVLTGKLVIDTWKALRDERRARRLRS